MPKINYTPGRRFTRQWREVIYELLAAAVEEALAPFK